MQHKLTDNISCHRPRRHIFQNIAASPFWLTSSSPLRKRIPLKEWIGTKLPVLDSSCVKMVLHLHRRYSQV